MEISIAEIIDAYEDLKSTYKVAKKLNLTRHYVKKVLKAEGKLRPQSQAAKERLPSAQYKGTEERKRRLSELAKERTGSKTPFYGKKHKPEVLKKISNMSKEQIGKLNPNYKHGQYRRRPRDYKVHEFAPLRNFVFNRDKFTCHYCKTKGGHLHAHHILPFWICNDAFLDSENLLTVCTNCHFDKAHIGDWQKFDLELITDRLIKKYSIRRERLNELASLWKKR